MFETVRPEIAAPRSRALMYETLPVSLAVHAVLIGAALGAMYWKVVFPAMPPRLMAMYSLEAPAPPPPPPPPPPKGSATPRPVRTDAPPVVTEIVAPTFIPEEIPLVTTQVLTLQQPGVANGVEGGVEGGVVGGILGGVVGGVIGGTMGGVVPPAAPPNTVVVARDEPLPLTPVSMVYPHYPEEARMRGWEDRVIVRYIIAKDGRVRDVQVLDKAERQLFTTTTVDAIRHWRFRPLYKDGAAQEVIHELTVYFKLENAA